MAMAWLLEHPWWQWLGQWLAFLVAVFVRLGLGHVVAVVREEVGIPGDSTSRVVAGCYSVLGGSSCKAIGLGMIPWHV